MSMLVESPTYVEMLILIVRNCKRSPIRLLRSKARTYLFIYGDKKSIIDDAFGKEVVVILTSGTFTKEDL